MEQPKGRETGTISAPKGGKSEQTGRRERPPAVISSPPAKPDDTRPRPTPPSPPAPKPDKERPKDRDLGDIVNDRKERRDKDRDRDHHDLYDVIIIEPETVYVPVPVPVPVPEPDTYNSTPLPDSSQDHKFAGEPLPPMTGTAEDALGDIRTAWLTSDSRFLERHLPVDADLRVYVDHKFSHSLPAQDFLTMTEDTMETSKTKSFEFVKIKGTETSLRATAQHTYTGSDGVTEKVARLTYYMTRIDGVWVIETIDILKKGSAASSVAPSTGIDTSSLEATVAVRGEEDPSTPGTQFITTTYRAPSRMVDDLRARSDAYVLGTSIPEN